MEDCIYVTLQSTPKFKRDFIVSLTTKEESTHKGRVFHFCSKNQIEQKEWFTALKNCIKQVCIFRLSLFVPCCQWGGDTKWEGALGEGCTVNFTYCLNT